MRKICYTLILLILHVKIFAQDSFGHRNIYFSGGFKEVKETANFGLVFRGPSLNVGINWHIPVGNKLIFYDGQFELASPISKGIVGVHTNIKPVEIALAWDIYHNQLNLKIGPSLKLEYKLDYYSDLQSGYNFWLTSYSTGVSAFASIPVNHTLVGLRFFNSLFGFTSRNEIYDDPYFFYPKFGEVIKDFHSNFEFVVLNSYNNTSFEISFKIKESSRLTFSYLIDYCIYKKTPSVKYLNQSIRLNLNSKKK